MTQWKVLDQKKSIFIGADAKRIILCHNIKFLLVDKSTFPQYMISQFYISMIVVVFIRVEADGFDYTIVFNFSTIDGSWWCAGAGCRLCEETARSKARIILSIFKL